MNERDVAEFILKKEGRFDAQGRLKVYRIPKGDGGGLPVPGYPHGFEVAGINNRYHPEMANRLRMLVERGEDDTAKEEAIDYLLDYTERVSDWHPDGRVRAFLRDCAFNRGPAGAAWMLQRALKTAGTYKDRIDWRVGPRTKRASAEHSAEDLAVRLILARQRYEVVHAKREEGNKFWDGLNNRWVNAYQVAMGVGDPFDDKR